jgi:regulatory protein
MAKITGLQADPRRPGAVRVLVDGRLFCTVHEGVEGSETLKVGADWTPDRAESAGRAADEEAAWRALLKALERRGHAVGELRRRLGQKGHPPEAVDHAITRALGAGLLDDAAFARQYVESRAARGQGPSRIRRDLSARGVSRSLVDTAVAAQWSGPEDALAAAAGLIQRRLRQLQGLPREVQRRRLLGYLARRGFAGSRVSDLVGRALKGT